MLSLGSIKPSMSTCDSQRRAMSDGRIKLLVKVTCFSFSPSTARMSVSSDSLRKSIWLNFTCISVFRVELIKSSSFDPYGASRYFLMAIFTCRPFRRGQLFWNTPRKPSFSPRSRSSHSRRSNCTAGNASYSP
uniref:(northern house mosquito) hypothetical protein n=1 Tax=Culex pipiens TaxID=7175 RepID=A0A8D8DQY1_CULPI